MDMKNDLGFRVGRWNQSYQVELLCNFSFFGYLNVDPKTTDIKAWFKHHISAVSNLIVFAGKKFQLSI